MEHEEYMRQALELARLAMAEGEVPVGCVIVRDGAVVGRGRNRRETAQTALGHAELEAIAQACRTLGGWRLAGCALYVTLEPCPMCAGAIVNARIPAVYYGAKDDKAGCCGSVLNLFEDKSRFNKFTNLPELMNIFREVADVQTADLSKEPSGNISR